jgi:hypothetical protein
MDDAATQLAIKQLDDHDRVYTKEDLDEDVHLARALKLIHSKKLGLPFFPDDMLEAIEEKLAVKNGARPALMHMLTSGRMEDSKEKSKKRVWGDLAQPETLKKRA